VQLETVAFGREGGDVAEDPVAARLFENRLDDRLRLRHGRSAGCRLAQEVQPREGNGGHRRNEGERSEDDPG
jgi:hypothetical protein